MPNASALLCVEVYALVGSGNRMTKVKIWLMCPREKEYHARILRYYIYPANARNIRTQSEEPRSIPIFSLPLTEASSVLTRAGVHHGTCSRTAQTSLSHARNSARPDVERCCRLSTVQTHGRVRTLSGLHARRNHARRWPQKKQISSLMFLRRHEHDKREGGRTSVCSMTPRPWQKTKTNDFFDVSYEVSFMCNKRPNDTTQLSLHL